MTDLQLFGHSCSMPTRPVRHWYESTAAELYMAECFTRWYGQRYPGSVVLSQVSYLHMQEYRGALGILMRWLAAEFRNVLSPKALAKNPASQAAGGRLKPDMLGVRTEGGTMLLELVEVTTEQQASRTMAEDVGRKLHVLDKFVLGDALRDMQDAERVGKLSLAPSALVARPSPWRPYWTELYLPLLPVSLDDTKPLRATFEWICYKPTFRPDGVGTSGLVLYEIHTTSLPQGVPEHVVRRTAARIKELEHQHELVLLPTMQRYWTDNRKDGLALQEALAYGLGATLLLTLVVLAWPAVVAAAAGIEGVEAGAGLTAVAVRFARLAGELPSLLRRAEIALRPLMAGGRGVTSAH